MNMQDSDLPTASMAACTALRVSNLSGCALEISPIPGSAREVKIEIQARWGTPLGLQRLLCGPRVLEDDEEIDAGKLDLTFVVDESLLFSWDVTGNPQRDLLLGDGCTVTFKDERCDYVNVVTQEPFSSGVHFFEFVMHQLQDEQWCGVTRDKERAGRAGSDMGWFYYSGRRSASRGALHAPKERVTVKDFDHVSAGDTISILVDMNLGVLVFMLNGNFQGSCNVPTEPLYVTTSLDREGDCVELRKPPLADVPHTAFEALHGEVFQVCLAQAEANDADISDCSEDD